MLTSTVIRLRAQQSGLLSTKVGEYGRAAFLAFIDQAAPELAQAIHDADQRKPYTVSLLAGGRWGSDGLRVIQGKEYWIRFTILEMQLYQAFSRYFALPHTFNLPLRLGDLLFQVEEVSSDPQFSPWAGFASYEALAQTARVSRWVTLQFLTPTAFSLGRTAANMARFGVFPEPGLVFDSLLRRWNRFADQPLYEDARTFQEWTTTNVLVCTYRAESCLWRFAQHPQIGFTGQVTYEIPENDPQMGAILHALAGFAFYAGVGKNTSIGMGQTRCRVDRKSAADDPWRVI